MATTETTAKETATKPNEELDLRISLKGDTSKITLRVELTAEGKEIDPIVVDYPTLDVAMRELRRQLKGMLRNRSRRVERMEINAMEVIDASELLEKIIGSRVAPTNRRVQN